MKFRRMTSDDLDAVVAIWLAGNLEAHDFVEADYWKANERAVREQIAEAVVYVAEVGGQVRGFVGMQGTWLAGLFVERDFRDQGIGAALLERVKAE